MPAVKSSLDSLTTTHKGSKRIRVERHSGESAITSVNDLPHDPPLCIIEYPLDESGRSAFRTCNGKKVTEHQWAVYDFARTIPRGRVTTYGALCKALGRGSPSSVGAALRHNPFAPFVPCHRVIASNLYIGGFFGEWGTSPSRKDRTPGQKCRKKMEMLMMEGVEFTADGYLSNEKLIWKG